MSIVEKKFPVQKLLLFIVLLAIGFVACKKTETVTIAIQAPAANFSVSVIEPFYTNQTPGTTSYIDSNFYFRNISDSGTNIVYRWDFGDGETSSEKNPKHRYAKRGTFTATLTVSNDKASGTAQRTISVALGQQHISFGDGTDISPIAIEETATNDFVLLGYNSYGVNYFLIQLDSLLKQQNIKTFPSTYRLNCMKPTVDGNYIFTGSIQSASKSNELIKMKADGTLLWNKTLTTDDAYSYAAQTPDGGYAVIGSRRGVTDRFGNINYNTVIVKTDNNGNQQWLKLLDQEGMINTNNAMIEQDGIVVAGTKGGNCPECDSIFVVKLNNTGNVVWKTTVLGGLNNFTWWDTRIAKLTNGNYAVTNGYTRGIFFFSPSGEFLDRKLAASQVAGVTSAADGNIIALQTEYGNGFRIAVSKISLDGAQHWNAYPEGRQKVTGGIMCCSTSWPVTIQPLRRGGTLTTGYRINYNSTGYNTYKAIVLLQLDDAGKPK